MTEINNIKEEVLIKRLIYNDKTAFELLFRYYYPGLVVFASQIVLDRDEAEEIVQDFFVSLWNNRMSLRKTNSLKSYCFTSIKNKSLNFLRKVKIDERVRSELKVLIETDKLYQPDFFVESDLQLRIKKALEKLPPRTKEVFALNRFENYSNEQIAQQLNISKRTVETHISNALKILREELKEFLFMLLLF